MSVLDSNSLQKFLFHFSATLTPELAAQFQDLPNDPEFQGRLDELAFKASDGTLTEAETSEYDTYIEATDVVAILRAKALARSTTRR